MSTKIWEAYKLKDPSKFWEVSLDIKQKALKSFNKILKDLYKEYMKIVDSDSEEYKKWFEQYEKHSANLIKDSFEQKDQISRLYVVRDLFEKEYKQSFKSIYRNLYNFDVSVAFHKFEENIYLIPYCDCLVKNTLFFLKRYKGIVDYHYQNQTDKPKYITNKNWEERRRVWNGVFDSHYTGNPLILEICNYDSFYMRDPWMEIARKIRKNNS